MLFLLVVGGAAVLEVHRAMNAGNKDTRELKRREDELRRQLQDLQRELQQTKSQRELTEKEAAHLSELNRVLAADKEALAAATSSLRAENEELARRAEEAEGRSAELEEAAGSLLQENSNLLAQFDRLKIKYEAESASFHEQLSELKSQISGALQRFAAGDMSADALLAFFSNIGVEVRCAAADLAGLSDALNTARSSEERMQLLDKVELQVDDTWLHQLRLSACPERAARLLMAARETPGGAVASNSGGAAALTYPQQPRKISTPNREQANAAKVPLLKLGSSGSAAGASAAMPALGSAKENQQQQQPLQQQAAAAVLPAVVTGPAVLTSSPVKGAQDPKSRSMVFLPKKRGPLAVAQGGKSKSGRGLELDVPLGEHNSNAGAGAGGFGRLGLHGSAGDEDELLSGGQALRAL